MRAFRFFHVSDLHHVPLGRRPKSRSATYREDCEFEWEGFCDAVRRDAPDAVLFSGDVFHVKNQSAFSPPDLDYYYKQFEKCSAKIYCIPGNHDLPQSAYSAVDQSAYQNLVRCTPNLRDVAGIHPTPVGSFVLGSKTYLVRVTGLPYLPLDELFEKLPQVESMLSDREQSFNIVLLHPDALPRNDLPLHFETCSWTDLLEALPSAHLLCLGHIHQSFPVLRHEGPKGPQFVSKPWSLGRVVRDYFATSQVLEHEHRPMYADVEGFVENGALQVTVTYRDLPYVPYARAFEPETLARELKRHVHVENFLTGLKRDYGSVRAAFAVESPSDYLDRACAAPEVREVIDEYLNR